MSDLIKFYLKSPARDELRDIRSHQANFTALASESQSWTNMRTRSESQLQISFVDYLPSHPMIGLRGQSNKLLCLHPDLLITPDNRQQAQSTSLTLCQDINTVYLARAPNMSSLNMLPIQPGYLQGGAGHEGRTDGGEDPGLVPEQAGQVEEE